jgi:hypothetical protein
LGEFFELFGNFKEILEEFFGLFFEAMKKKCN